MDKILAEMVVCTECGQKCESGFVDDDGVCDECAPWEDDGQPSEAQEWHDFDPEC
jgi:hypothetical protein